MKFRVIIPKKIRKQILKLPSNYQEAVINSLLELRTDPYIGKKLEDQLENKYSLRVGVYRILYQIFKSELVVMVVSVGHRREVYKRK